MEGLFTYTGGERLTCAAAMAFDVCTLKVPIGEYEAGDNFDTIEFEFDRGIITLHKYNVATGKWKLTEYSFMILIGEEVERGN